MNLTYLRRNRKNLLRNAYSPGRDTSAPCSYAYRRSSVYYDGCGHGGRGPCRASYSRKTSLRSAPGSGPATGSKNYSSSPLRDGAYSALYKRNGLSYRKMTYKGARRAWKRTCLAFSLRTTGRYYTQPLAI